MLFPSIRLFYRREGKPANLPQESAESLSRPHTQDNLQRSDLESQVHHRNLKTQLQEMRSNYFLERRTFW